MSDSQSSLADRTIAALRANHVQLSEIVTELTDDQLTGPSAAGDWTVADVLSHVGSGAEIGRYPILRAAGEEVDAPENQAVWDRWNAMTPQDQAREVLESDGQFVATVEALTPGQRDSLQVDLGFLPQPVPLATALGMRLNEQALHGWDVRVAVDPNATLGEENAELLVEHFTSTMTFLLGFVGKPGGVGPARVGLGDHTVVIGDGVSLETGTDDTTATFDGPLEAGVRLLAGRLKDPYIPDGVEVTGNVSLGDLRKVFPGY